MAFENLSEQIKESLINLRSRITESESFNRLDEAYNNLTPRQQKMILVLGAFVGAVFLLNIPLQSFLTSQSELTNYKDQKQIIQRLHVAAQLKSQSDFQPERFDIGRLENDLLSRMGSFQITPTQFKLSPAEPETLGVPRKALTSGFSLNLSNLNVRQISRAASLLENYSDSILVTSLKSTASPDNPHYFNTEFKLLNFYVPEDESSGNPTPSFRGR